MFVNTVGAHFIFTLDIFGFVYVCFSGTLDIIQKIKVHCVLFFHLH